MQKKSKVIRLFSILMLIIIMICIPRIFVLADTVTDTYKTDVPIPLIIGIIVLVFVSAIAIKLLTCNRQVAVK